jgi:hypothetical protein
MNTTTPTDEQIDALWRKSCELNELTRDMVRHFARAVLAAQPQPKPVAWAMPRGDGFFLDVITPEEHERHEGE